MNQTPPVHETQLIMRRQGRQRLASGHPWYFAQHLRFNRATPMGVYDIRSESGEWLGRGLFNPKSKIVFRMLATEEKFKQLNHHQLIGLLLRNAIQRRNDCLSQRQSCRLVHGEADHLSGLIIDVFFTQNEKIIIVVQSQTGAVDTIIESVLSELKDWSKNFSKVSIIIKNDSSKRIRENLLTSVQIVHGPEVDEVESIRLNSRFEEMQIHLRAPLVSGQKTGFFLDQSFNIDMVYEHARLTFADRPVRMLDLCCYVGQWSAKLAGAMASHGIAWNGTLVDSSSKALSLASDNVQKLPGSFQTLKCDVFDHFHPENQCFDLVISDPPALIKDRKHTESGKHGYLKLNALAIAAVKTGGMFVGCSCSGVLSRRDFKSILEKSAIKAQRKLLWIAEGQQSLDHPFTESFPEGEYLKCFVARIY